MPTPPRPPPDQRGAVMVVALFMAVFLCGIVFALRGVGESIRYRERLQDAADTGAYRAATQHARAMNVIGLTNLAELATVAVLQTSRLILNNTAFCSPGSTIGGAFPFTLCPGIDSQYQGVIADARLPRLLASATATAEGIRDSSPTIARELVNQASSKVATVFVERPLPLKTADLSSLCAKNNLYLPGLMALGVPSAVLRPDVFREQPTARVRRSPYCPDLPYGPQLPRSGPANQSGTEPLQVRTLAIGDSSELDLTEQGVEVPGKLYRGVPAATRDAAAAVRDFAVTQAEYYSAWSLANSLQRDSDTRIPEETLYFMNWRARLRRLRVPVEVAPAEAMGTASVRTWLDDQAIPSCRDQACALGRCGRCDDLGLLEAFLGSSVH